jgi:Uma2 family endonuclease
MIALTLRPTLQLTDEVFERICQQNPDLRLERTAQGELIAMAPAGSESGRQNLSLSAQLWQWNRQTKLGVTFDWGDQARWECLSPEQRHRFAPLCPDFVLELKSPSDEIATLHAKLAEYLANGAQLGWLIDPEQQRVYTYGPDQPVQEFHRPDTLSGDPVLPNFVMDFTLIWP